MSWSVGTSARWRNLALALGLLLAGTASLVWWRFAADVEAARQRVAAGGTLIETSCGPVEYQETGEGMPLLSVHGSGGGFDQGMAFAAPLASQGVRVIAISRFGYLRTPMPSDHSAEAQADAFVCLLDSLGIERAAILGGSAGAPSALQMAIRHPDRVTALILLVPLAYKPPILAPSAEVMPAWMEDAMMRVVGSNFLFWAAKHVARDTLIETVLATPAELVTDASAAEKARINAMLDDILPVSARAKGLRSDTAAGKALAPSRLDLVKAPTLVISAKDDGYGTYASAQYTAAGIKGARFLGFDTGGHLWVGHNDEVMGAVLHVMGVNGDDPGE